MDEKPQPAQAVVARGRPIASAAARPVASASRPAAAATPGQPVGRVVTAARPIARAPASAATARPVAAAVGVASPARAVSAGEGASARAEGTTAAPSQTVAAHARPGCCEPSGADAAPQGREAPPATPASAHAVGAARAVAAAVARPTAAASAARSAPVDSPAEPSAISPSRGATPAVAKASPVRAAAAGSCADARAVQAVARAVPARAVERAAAEAARPAAGEAAPSARAQPRAARAEEAVPSAPAREVSSGEVEASTTRVRRLPVAVGVASPAAALGNASTSAAEPSPAAACSRAECEARSTSPISARQTGAGTSAVVQKARLVKGSSSREEVAPSPAVQAGVAKASAAPAGVATAPAVQKAQVAAASPLKEGVATASAANARVVKGTALQAGVATASAAQAGVAKGSAVQARVATASAEQAGVGAASAVQAGVAKGSAVQARVATASAEQAGVGSASAVQACVAKGSAVQARVATASAEQAGVAAASAVQTGVAKGSAVQARVATASAVQAGVAKGSAVQPRVATASAVQKAQAVEGSPSKGGSAAASASAVKAEATKAEAAKGTAVQAGAGPAPLVQKALVVKGSPLQAGGSQTSAARAVKASPVHAGHAAAIGQVASDAAACGSCSVLAQEVAAGQVPASVTRAAPLRVAVGSQLAAPDAPSLSAGAAAPSTAPPPPERSSKHDTQQNDANASSSAAARGAEAEPRSSGAPEVIEVKVPRGLGAGQTLLLESRDGRCVPREPSRPSAHPLPFPRCYIRITNPSCAVPLALCLELLPTATPPLTRSLPGDTFEVEVAPPGETPATAPSPHETPAAAPSPHEAPAAAPTCDEAPAAAPSREAVRSPVDAPAVAPSLASSTGASGAGSGRKLLFTNNPTYFHPPEAEVPARPSSCGSGSPLPAAARLSAASSEPRIDHQARGISEWMPSAGSEAAERQSLLDGGVHFGAPSRISQSPCLSRGDRLGSVCPSLRESPCIAARHAPRASPCITARGMPISPSSIASSYRQTVPVVAARRISRISSSPASLPADGNEQLPACAEHAVATARPPPVLASVGTQTPAADSTAEPAAADLPLAAAAESMAQRDAEAARVARVAAEARAAVVLQARLKGMLARLKPHLVPGTRVEVVLSGVPGVHAGTCRWRGALPQQRRKSSVWLGVELDDAVGASDGALPSDRSSAPRVYFRCAPRHGAFVPPSRCRLEHEDFDFDFELDESDDGSLDFSIASDDSGRVREALKLSAKERLVSAVQRVFRGKLGRALAEREAMRSLFMPPPHVSYDARGEVHVLTRLTGGGTDAAADWELRLDVEGVSGKSLEHLVARAVIEVDGGPRLVFRTLRSPPFVVSASEAFKRVALLAAAPPGGEAELSCRVTIRWVPFFNEPPLALSHRLVLEGRVGEERAVTTLRHPDVQVGRPRRVTATELEMARLLQSRWRERLRRVEELHPDQVRPRPSPTRGAAMSIQSVARMRSAIHEKASVRAMHDDLSSWGTLKERADQLPEDFEASELQDRVHATRHTESTLEAVARRQRQRQQLLAKRALRLEEEAVHVVRCVAKSDSTPPEAEAGADLLRHDEPERGGTEERRAPADESTPALERRQQSARALQAHYRGRRARVQHAGGVRRPPQLSPPPDAPLPSPTGCTPPASPAPRADARASPAAAAGDVREAPAIRIQSHARRRRSSAQAAAARAVRQAAAAAAAAAPGVPIELTLARLNASAAAAGIQAAARGRHARRSSFALHQQRRESHAALRLQTAWRGGQARQLARGASSLRAAAVGLGSAELCALPAAEFERLLQQLLSRRREAKRRAVAAEDFEGAQRHKAALDGVEALRVRLAECEWHKRRAVRFEDFHAAAQIKRETDELRVQIARALHGAREAAAAAGGSLYMADERASFRQGSHEYLQGHDMSEARPPTRDAAASSQSRPPSAPRAPTRLQSPTERRALSRPGTASKEASQSASVRVSRVNSPQPSVLEVDAAVRPMSASGASPHHSQMLQLEPAFLYARPQSGALRSLAPAEAAIARPIVDTFGEQVATLFFSDKEKLRQAAIEQMGDLLGSPQLLPHRRVALQVIGQVLSRVFSSDRSAVVLRAALQLLRTLLSSTVALATGTELARMTHRLLPSFLTRASDELFSEQEARHRSVSQTSNASPAFDGAAEVVEAMRWMAHQPRVGAARLAGPLLSIDAANASERLLLRRLLVLQQLLCLAPTSTVGGVAEGKDARILPLSATAHFICDAYSRGEPRLRAAALRAAASLFESASRASPADARALHQLLKTLHGPLLAALGEEIMRFHEEPRAAQRVGDTSRSLQAALEATRKLESSLTLDLHALRTRRRQWEMRVKSATAKGGPRSTLGNGPHSHAVNVLRGELAEVVTAHEQAEIKLRALKQQRLRARPKDIQTIERARRLLEEPKAEVARAHSDIKSSSYQLEQRTLQLKDKLRSEQLTSHQEHTALERTLLEERILDSELALVAPRDSHGEPGK
ncbi:hypothetical protein AB1Y20_019489 [Prymnesium parvum]|uniref:CAP-Gly domain-containing protein n=1 Tax=Prymnesium parvum TaxID=97485 RepID=A0AB34JSP6_PRYPA